ncbi:MAG: hypothetical protein WC529_08235 [Candidatus Margulisiibacteriota bacterium]
MGITSIYHRFIDRLSSGKTAAHPVRNPDSAQALRTLLAARGKRSATLTGLYNARNGQLLFGCPTHKELAEANNLLTPQNKLKSDWHGFRCYYELGKPGLEISPESGVFGKIPDKHLAKFKKTMDVIFGEEFPRPIAYRYHESEPPVRPSVSLPRHPAVEPVRPVINDKPAALAQLAGLIARAETEHRFFAQAADTLIDYCLASGKELGQALTALKTEPSLKFKTMLDSLPVMMVSLRSRLFLRSEQLRPEQKLALEQALLNEANIRSIFGITD